MTLERSLQDIVMRDPILKPALEAAAETGLPDCWIVSGAVCNSVWNRLGGRDPGYGIRDIDVFYHDGSDLSREAEDRVIEAHAQRFAKAPPVRIRNQARVHLWYEGRFGQPCPPLRDCRHGISCFPAETLAVGVRLAPGFEVFAPYGLGAIFERRLRPNPRRPNRMTYEKTAARIAEFWPEVDIAPWPDGPVVVRADEWTDWTAVHGLLLRAFAYMRDRIDPPSSLDRMTPESLSMQGTCLIAVDNGTPVACVFCELRTDHLYIAKLAVEPSHQGSGLGRTMIGAAERFARDNGLGAIGLQTRVELVENHARFARMGFVEIGRTAHPGFDRPTSVTMRKTL